MSSPALRARAKTTSSAWLPGGREAGRAVHRQRRPAVGAGGLLRRCRELVERDGFAVHDRALHGLALAHHPEADRDRLRRAEDDPWADLLPVDEEPVRQRDARDRDRRVAVAPARRGGAALTTAVGTDVDWVEPSAFRAVTRERIVLSMSSFFSTYVLSVAPPMFEQLPPLASQRRHWYTNEVGEPLHVPLLVVSVLPSWAVPEIVGGDWFPGAAWGAAAPPVSARPATAASRSSAPIAASPSSFSFVRMSSPSSDALLTLVLSTWAPN